MYGDADWAQGWIAKLEPLRQPSTAILELRAAGVSESRIQLLYPPLDLSEYRTAVIERLANPETLRHVTNTLTMFEFSKLLDSLPQEVKSANDSRISTASNDLLDMILAMPEETRPESFVQRNEIHLSAINFALALCEQLFGALIVLGYIASGDADFQHANAAADMRVHQHRIRHIVRRLA